MALHLRSGDSALTLNRDGDSVVVDGAAVDARAVPLPTAGAAQTLLVIVDGRPTVATVERDGSATRVWIGSQAIEVQVRTDTDLLLERFGLDTGDTAAEREVRAPMPGLVLRVLAEAGEAVEAGAGIVVLEAMKMENVLTAPASGTVAALHVEAGAAVGKGDLLVDLDPT